jgi:hypothetical protein
MILLEINNKWVGGGGLTSPGLGHDLTRSFGNGVHPSGVEFYVMSTTEIWKSFLLWMIDWRKSKLDQVSIIQQPKSVMIRRNGWKFRLERNLCSATPKQCKWNKLLAGSTFLYASLVCTSCVEGMGTTRRPEKDGRSLLDPFSVEGES